MRKYKPPNRYFLYICGEWIIKDQQTAKTNIIPFDRLLRYPSLKEAWTQLQRLGNRIFVKELLHQNPLPYFIQSAKIFQAGKMLLSKQRQPSISSYPVDALYLRIFHQHISPAQFQRLTGSRLTGFLGTEKNTALFLLIKTTDLKMRTQNNPQKTLNRKRYAEAERREVPLWKRKGWSTR